MGTPITFERTEVKYLITDTQRSHLDALLEREMAPDPHGSSTVYSIYYDTPTYQLIRHSLEKPLYKEKLRVRSYGAAKAEDTVYVELKKKYQGIVYKRRVAMSREEAMGWLSAGEPPEEDCQILREIDYFRDFYSPLSPSVFLSSRREAYFGREDGDLRMTFDSSILWRDYDLTLAGGAYGLPLLSPGVQLLEVKFSQGVPLWLSRFFSKSSIFKTNFSKYGSAYEAICRRHKKGGIQSA